MALLAYQQATVVGTTLTMDAAGGSGDTVAVASDGLLLVRNGSGASLTVTITVPGSKYGQARPDISKVILAGGFAVFGPFPADIADPTDRLVHVDYSDEANVTVAAINV